MKNHFFVLAKHISALVFLFFTPSLIIKAQSPGEIKLLNDSTAVISLSKLKGYGPIGSLSSSVTSVKTFEQSSPGLLPILKKTSESLIDPEVFFFIYDQPQFYYQRFVSGNCSKELMTQKLKEYNLMLKDTSKLSRTPINCAFYLVAGKDRKNKLQFIADQNNNFDLSDDSLITLPRMLTVTQRTELAFQVSLQFRNILDRKIVTQKVNCTLIGYQSQNGINLSIFFPEYNLANVNLHGSRFVVCTSRGVLGYYLHILKDVPLFTTIGLNDAVHARNKIMIGSSDFLVEDISSDGSKVIVIGKDAKDLAKY